ncbi:MAG: DUF1194 domain-containing protein [Cyanobacteria bacterium]|nr:DUF1194 domain-containing protein [Cyanobacteriota bacterium]MDW8200105.1 DUF1194 domain-containing protein [Cyanobacteriota bacterium SKYGB_h_bin112]
MSRAEFLPWFLSTVQRSLAPIATAGVAIAVCLPATAASLIPVDVELSLLIDVSGSVNTREYALQMGGYQRAFTNLAPQFAMGKFGNVAINAILWSGASQQKEVVPWTLVNDQTSALLFASQIGSVNRPFAGSTAPGSAINYAVPLFSSNAYEGARWVIDVSGDGAQNSGTSTVVARDNALAAGVDTINGLPILGEFGLQSWYERNIIGGTNAFVLPANGFEDFGRAIEQKLVLELSRPEKPGLDNPGAIPEPTTIVGMVLAGGGLVMLKRRKQNS